MKRLLPVLLLFLFSSPIRSQNFLNGDFEINTAGVDQINLSNAAFNSMISFTTGFGTFGDLDIITSAVYSGGPQNGSWYIGMTGGGTDMIAMELSTPLVAGNTYGITFWDKAHQPFFPMPIEIGVSNSNINFGTVVYTTTGLAQYGIWTQRTFTFVAPFSAPYITVSMQGALQNWVNVDNFSFTSCSISVSLGNDTTLCPGQSLTLDATYPGATYLWQNGATSSSISVSQPGSYWVQISDSCGTASDTIQIVPGVVPVVALGNDTTLCAGTSITLDATFPGAAYLWQNGSTAATLQVTMPGTYWVTATNFCGTSTDSITISYLQPPSVNLGPDTTLCQGASINLNAAFPGSSYVWQDGSSGSSYNVTQPGNYYVIVSNACGSDRDTVVVGYLNAPEAAIGNDTTICDGTSIVLSAFNNGASYLWSNGSTSSSIQVGTAGTYSVAVTNLCGTDIDSITIATIPQPIADIGSDTSFCSGNTYVLDAFFPGSTYLWQDGSSGPTITVTSSGTYSVTVSNSCGSSTDAVLVTVYPIPVVNLGADTTLCNGDTIALDASWQQASYAWNDGSNSAQLNVTAAGIYWVTVTENNCIATDTIVIVLQNCNVQLTMPTVFTPNGDGLNDVFTALEYDGIAAAKLNIFNRWGNQVAEINDIPKGWDGSDLPEGTYYWIITYTDTNGKQGSLNGTVTLLKKN